MSHIKKIIVKASRNYRAKKEKIEDERLRKQPDRSPLLLVLYLLGLSGLILIAGEAVGVSRSLYPIIIGAVSLFTILLWYLYFYQSRLFIITSVLLIVGAVLLAAPGIFQLARFIAHFGMSITEARTDTGLLIVLMVLAVYLLFSLEFVLRNHFILLLIGLTALAAIPASGYSVSIFPMLLLMTFEIGFIVVNMTERRRLRDSLVMKRKPRAGLICGLLSAAILLTLFLPAFLIEKSAQDDLFHAVYVTDSYIKDLFSKMTGFSGDNVSGGHINRGNLYRTGEEILQVRLDKRPIGTVYLHSFRGSDYLDGEWENAYKIRINNDSDLLYQEPFMSSLLRRHSKNRGEMSSALYFQFQSLSRPTTDPVSEMYFMLADGTLSIESAYSDYLNDDEYQQSYYNYTNPNLTLYNEKATTLSIRHLSENYAGPLMIPYYSAESEARIWSNNLITRDDGYRNPFLYPQNISMADKWKDYGFYEDFVNDYIKETEKNYRSYPTDTFERLEKLCRETPLNTLDEIVTYVLVTLQNHARYSTTPGTTPYNKDVIDHFLFDSGQGYCVHFASAATLMLRMYGIPARYVSGFVIEPEVLQQETENGRTYYTAAITDEYAHAWTEIFLKDYGWVPLEVTPTENGTMVTSFPGYSTALMRRIMNEHGWHFRGSDNGGYNLGNRGVGEQIGTILHYSVIIIPPAILAGGIGFFLLRRRYRLKRLSAIGCRRLFDLILRLLHSCRQLPDMNGSEPGFAEQLAALSESLSMEDCTRIIAILQQVNYSESKASKEDRDFLEDCYRRLARDLYHAASPPRKLFLKFIKAYL